MEACHWWKEDIYYCTVRYYPSIGWTWKSMVYKGEKYPLDSLVMFFDEDFHFFKAIGFWDYQQNFLPELFERSKKICEFGEEHTDVLALKSASPKFRVNEALAENQLYYHERGVKYYGPVVEIVYGVLPKLPF
jgi:hypothetical protein